MAALEKHCLTTDEAERKSSGQANDERQGAMLIKSKQESISGTQKLHISAHMPRLRSSRSVGSRTLREKSDVSRREEHTDHESYKVKEASWIPHDYVDPPGEGPRVQDHRGCAESFAIANERAIIGALGGNEVVVSIAAREGTTNIGLDSKDSTDTLRLCVVQSDRTSCSQEVGPVCEDVKLISNAQGGTEKVENSKQTTTTMNYKGKINRKRARGSYGAESLLQKKRKESPEGRLSTRNPGGSGGTMVDDETRRLELSEKHAPAHVSTRSDNADYSNHNSGEEKGSGMRRHARKENGKYADTDTRKRSRKLGSEILDHERCTDIDRTSRKEGCSEQSSATSAEGEKFKTTGDRNEVHLQERGLVDHAADRPCSFIGQNECEEAYEDENAIPKTTQAAMRLQTCDRSRTTFKMKAERFKVEKCFNGRSKAARDRPHIVKKCSDSDVAAMVAKRTEREKMDDLLRCKRMNAIGGKLTSAEGSCSDDCSATSRRMSSHNGMVSVRGPTAFDQVKYELRACAGSPLLERPALRSSGQVTMVQVMKFIREQLGLVDGTRVVISCAGVDVSDTMTLSLLVDEVWREDNGHLVLNYKCDDAPY